MIYAVGSTIDLYMQCGVPANIEQRHFVKKNDILDVD